MQKLSAGDRWIAVGLFVIGMVTRLPFQSEFLYHWDSVNFALALERFDVRLHQPHPPGTFVFYVLLGRLFNSVLHDANASLVWISIISSGLAVALAFVLGRSWFDRWTGVVVALLTLTGPLVWFHSEVALSYMLEFWWVLLMVLLCSRALHGDVLAFGVASLCLGIAGGIRPNTPVFMFPLWAFVALRRRSPLWQVAAALALMAIGVVMWAVPMVVMSGGPVAYWETAQWWSTQHLARSEGANALVYMARFAIYTTYALGVALIPIAWAGWRYRCELAGLLWRDWRAQMLAVWIVPGGAYLAFVHLKQAGHTFTIMPALYVVAALAALSLARRLGRGEARRVWAVIAILVIANALAFLLGPARVFPSPRSVWAAPTWADIRGYDAFVGTRLTAIRATFAPDDTAVLAGPRYFRLPDFYLRDYRLPSLSHDLDKGPITLPSSVRTLVLFDDDALHDGGAADRFHTLPLATGEAMRYLQWEEGTCLYLSRDSFALKPCKE